MFMLLLRRTTSQVTVIQSEKVYRNRINLQILRGAGRVPFLSNWMIGFGLHSTIEDENRMLHVFVFNAISVNPFNAEFAFLS